MEKASQIVGLKKTGSTTEIANAVNTSNIEHLGFDNASVANIIFTISSGKIVLVNKAALKLFRYSKKALLTKNKAGIFETTELGFKRALKQRTTEKPAVPLIGIKKGGTPFPCEINHAIFLDDNGVKNAIISITDKTQSILQELKMDIKRAKAVSDNIILAKAKQQKNDTRKKQLVLKNILLAKVKQKGIDIRNKKIVDENILLAKANAKGEKVVYENAVRKKVIREIEANFKIIFNSSSDALIDINLINGKVVMNDAYVMEFDHNREKSSTVLEDWATYIHPDDKEQVMEDYESIFKSAKLEWKTGYRFIRTDGTVANVLSSRIILRDADGKAYRMIGTLRDISKQKVLEERLEEEIRLKELQILEASEDAKNSERSDIGKELHDNINQLLGASRLYLEMAKKGGKDSAMYLNRSSEYTLTAIEEIRKLSKGLTTDIIRNLGLNVAIENIINDTMELNSLKIVCSVKESVEKTVNDKFKLNIYRIIQEQLNNILKHAKATKVFIKLNQNKKYIKLIISDNGIGFDTSKKRNGIGVANIKSRAASYNGIADFISHPGSGCVLTATFSANDRLLTRA